MPDFISDRCRKKWDLNTIRMSQSKSSSYDGGVIIFGNIFSVGVSIKYLLCIRLLCLQPYLPPSSPTHQTIVLRRSFLKLNFCVYVLRCWVCESFKYYHLYMDCMDMVMYRCVVTYTRICMYINTQESHKLTNIIYT